MGPFKNELMNIEKFIGSELNWVNSRKQSLRNPHTNSRLEMEMLFDDFMSKTAWCAVWYLCAKLRNKEDAIIANRLNQWLKIFEDKLNRSEVAAAVDLKYLHELSKTFKNDKMKNYAENIALAEIFKLTKNTYDSTTHIAIKQITGQTLGYWQIRIWFSESINAMGRILPI